MHLPKELMEKMAAGLESGFVTDPNCKRLDEATYGLNLTVCWPLPFKEMYEKIAKDLSEDCVYVYPYEFTHVTIMTLVNFNKHFNSTEQEITELGLAIPSVIEAVNKVVKDMNPFTLDFGKPVLTNNAGIIPILNKTGEIKRIRGVELDLPEMNIPGIIHSTFVRFMETPEKQAFIEKFNNAVQAFGETTVSELLLTSETKPYMRSGEVLHRFVLK